MLNKIIIFSIMIMILSVGGISAETYTVDDPLIIDMAHHDANPDPYVNNKKATVLLFKDHIERISGGKIQVKEYAGTLGGAMEVLSQAQSGLVDIAVTHEGALSSIFKPVEVLLIPYIFDNEYVVDKVLDGEFGRKFSDALLEETGLRNLAFYDNSGFRHIVNSKRPVRTPEDIKGLKFRTVESAAQVKIFDLLGATATPIAWGETYSSIQTGVVDGLNNNANGLLNASLYEVTDYITLDGHVYAPGFIVTNNEWFESLPVEFQNNIKEAAEIAKWASRVVVRMIEARGYERLEEEEGMEITVLTEEEKQQFVDKTKEPFKEWLSGRIDPEWIESIETAVEKVNEERNSFYQ